MCGYIILATYKDYIERFGLHNPFDFFIEINGVKHYPIWRNILI